MNKLGSYAAHDHYGTDQAKEGVIMAPVLTVRNGRTGYMETRIRHLAVLRYRGRDAHAMRSLLERR